MNKKIGLHKETFLPEKIRSRFLNAPEVIQTDLKRISAFELKTVSISGKNRQWQFLVPKNQDEIIQFYLKKPNKHGPYWAEIWPAGLVLLDYLQQHPKLSGKKVLELGSGIGISGISLMEKDGLFVFSDIDELSIKFCRVNHYLNYKKIPNVIRFSWQHPPVKSTFDYIVASDVLYQKNDYDVLKNCLKLISGTKTILILTEPGRSFAQPFLDQILSLGEILVKKLVHQKVGERTVKINLFEILMRP